MILYYLVLLSDVDLFVVYPLVVEGCPLFAFILHSRIPVNFNNVLEVVKVQACLLCSCVVENICSLFVYSTYYIYTVAYCYKWPECIN